MHEQTISIFGNKILFEILNEIKIFSKYKVKFFENYNKYLEDKKTLCLVHSKEINHPINSSLNKRIIRRLVVIN